MNNKTHDLLLEIIRQHQKPSVTSIMKLCYLIDLVSIKRHNAKISDFTYRRYKFGPFDKDIYSNLEALVLEGAIVPQEEYSDQNEYIVYSIASGYNSPSEYLSEEDKNVIKDLLGELKGFGAKGLQEIAYNTKPMNMIGATIGGNEHLNEVLDLNAVLS